MWYLAVLLLVAIWIAVDATQRHIPAGQVALWVLGGVVLLPLVLPAYFARRRLYPDERRAGGGAWNFLKYCAIVWTVLLPINLLGGAVSAFMAAGQANSDVERAAIMAGAFMGLTIQVGAWLVGLIVCLVLGYFLRKPHEVEVGPPRMGAPSTAG